MLSETEVRKMYDKALQRATEYSLSANEDNHMNELYELHTYFAVSLGKVLEIDSRETMQNLKDRITLRYTKI
ncbi:MAG: hypothetical protein J5965_20930 [Aeriscardovia sp.]|nr:hypothetical protein [Aeriscardovia sp.]